MKLKSFFYILLLVCAVIGSSIATAKWLTTEKQTQLTPPISTTSFNAQKTNFSENSSTNRSNTDFTLAAEKSVNSVVHIKTKMTIQQNTSIDPFFEFFFGQPNRPQQPREQMASGSGVIISNDGYIITNNHVVNNSNSVEVVLNDKRQFDAQIIGIDPSTDIALLKIDAQDLPTLSFGNSDDIKIGEWVLAVGNPFNLTSTVTAGIISAKARNINILDSDMKIESFIQTDAAVNPGNSGGALVNTKGELIGINTAIASRTGSYTGYSFAVPISIASKVVADLKEYGVVQRALLGIRIRDIDSNFAKEKNLATLKGVYIAQVEKESAAYDAKLQTGDIITAINGIPTHSVSQLQEQVGRYRPGNKVSMSFIRNQKQKNTTVEFKNKSGNTEIVKASPDIDLGINLTPIDSQTKRKFNLSSGLEVSSVKSGSIFSKAGIQKGFIVLKINNSYITSKNDFINAYESATHKSNTDKVLFITGLYPSGKIVHYAINLN